MTITAALTALVMAVAIGVALAIVIKVIKSKKGSIAGVLSSEMEPKEVKIVTRLIKEELAEQETKEALQLLKRVVDKAAEKNGL